MTRSDDQQRSDTARVEFTAAIDDLQKVLARLDQAHCTAVYELARAVLASWHRGGKLLVCGNGGSAADAQHIVAELVGRYLVDRPGFPAIALTTNTSTATAVGNDYGFAQIFARQVTALGRPDDVLLVISTSGDSANCVAAVAAAREIGMAVYGFLGRSGGQLLPLVDSALVVPSDATPKIQEVHITMGHLLCRLLEQWAVSDGLTGLRGGSGPATDE
jgi:D-sedoheptulose 7-phosphate isomerase